MMPTKTKRHSKHWFREFLRQRFRNGELVAASVQVVNANRKSIASGRQKMLFEVAAEFDATLIYGRRGGMWSAVFAMPQVQLDEELCLRALGEEVRPGYNEHQQEITGGIAGWLKATRSQLHRQRNWYVRRWRGRPFLCIRIPREKRWYDVRGYLVK